MIANDVSSADSGFDSDYNRVTVFSKQGHVIHLEREAKRTLAFKLLSIISHQI